MFWLGLLVGVFVGCIIGYFICTLMSEASRADDLINAFREGVRTGRKMEKGDG